MIIHLSVFGDRHKARCGTSAIVLTDLGRSVTCAYCREFLEYIPPEPAPAPVSQSSNPPPAG